MTVTCPDLTSEQLSGKAYVLINAVTGDVDLFKRSGQVMRFSGTDARVGRLTESRVRTAILQGGRTSLFPASRIRSPFLLLRVENTFH
jgi:hypothetical protein